MSATFSTFCNDVIADAAIQPPIANGTGGEIMTLAITTDTGDYLAIHFKNQTNFKAFCAKHNFPLECNRNAN
tara:strand:- start:301 stop:516 length:216 start_codon:yes stop_codon:yes gene_type:complete